MNYDSLDDCLARLAGDLGTSDKLLREYAAEDTIGGRSDKGFPWASSSISTNEGKLIYAVIRHLRPEIVVEIGALGGCSASNILSALEANDFGHLTSIDINLLGRPGLAKGLPLYQWSFIQGNAETCDWEVPRVDLLLEDSAHTEQSTRICVRRGMNLGAKFVFVHDAMNNTCGEEVRRGLWSALPTYSILNLEDSNRGLAYWCERMGRETRYWHG